MIKKSVGSRAIRLRIQKLWVLLACLALAGGIWLVPAGSIAAVAVFPEPSLLSLQDLPTGFVAVPPAEIEGCRPQGDRGDLAAFVLKTGQHLQESICLSSFLLTEQAANPSQAALMRQMFDAILDHPESMVEQTGAPQGGVSVLSPVSGLGDKAAGFRQQTDDRQHEILLFRRGDFFGSVAVDYPTGTVPPAILQSIAGKLDRRLMQPKRSLEREPVSADRVK